MGVVTQKPMPKPVWWKNTYFWIAGILFILGIVGLISGDQAIRDPGQKRESGLAWMYFAAAVVMYLNGFMSHRQTVEHYEEVTEGGETK